MIFNMLTLVAATFAASSNQGAVGYYDIRNDSMVSFKYQEVYYNDQISDSRMPFLLGCNNGACDILDWEGNPTKIQGIPSSAKIERFKWAPDFYTIQSGNKISGFSIDGEEFSFPDFSVLEIDGVMDSTKLCKRSIIARKPATTCYDIRKKQMETHPFLSSYVGGFGFIRAKSKNQTRKESSSKLILGDKIIAENIAACSIYERSDNETFVQCCPEGDNGYNCPKSKMRLFDLNGREINSRFGFFSNQLDGFNLSIKEDKFGAESLIVSVGDTRIGGGSNRDFTVSSDFGYVGFRVSETSNICFSISGTSSSSCKVYYGSIAKKFGNDTIILQNNEGYIRASYGPNKGKYFESTDYPSKSYFVLGRIVSFSRNVMRGTYDIYIISANDDGTISKKLLAKDNAVGVIDGHGRIYIGVK